MSRLDALEARWPAISDLLDEALALADAERDAWLSQLDGERAALAPTLRELIAAHIGVETGDFLETLPQLSPPRGAAVAAGTEDFAVDVDPAEGRTIGPYRLISELGRGGMGAVWLAVRVDGQMTRRVALKLPRLAWGSAFAERLARERNILASLEHPNIARLYDAGLDRAGRPYFAMEYIDGLPIDAWCREKRAPLRDRIGLLLQVSQAVAHAHSRLVIHRDLKPGNILVTADARVRLLDFGIAKLMEGEHTEETALTRESGRALTLDYASPEQISGAALSTASDVYSLGVVAYELLSGAKPYRLVRGSAAELEEAIAAADVSRMSEVAVDPMLKKQLRGDLDAILNKALKKDPTQRYASVEALAQDFQRHLDQEPVLAQPDTIAYRAGKFVRRHRLQATAAGLVVMALLGGAGVALWQAREARMQAARASTEAATAKAVQGFIEAVFHANSGDQADPQKARDTTARELLDLGAQRIQQTLGDQPEARLRLLAVLAQMYEGMALFDEALVLHRQRLSLVRDVAGPRSSAAAQVLADLAYVLAYVDKRKEATEAVDEAARILDAAHDHASKGRFDVDLTYALLHARGDYTQGLAAVDRAVANARARSASADLVRALQVQGDMNLATRDYAKAKASVLEAIAMVEADPTHGANNLSAVTISLGQAQMGQGELDDADETFRKALALAKTHNAVAPVFIHTTERVYASFLRRHGRLRDSLEYSRPAYEWARSTAGRFGITPAELVADYARVLLAFGHVDEGLAALDEADALLARIEEAPEVSFGILLFRAQALIEQGHFDRAEEALVRSQAFRDQSKLGPAPQLTATWRALFVARGEAPRALREFQAEREQRGRAPRLSADESPRALTESAWLHWHAGLPEWAREQAQLAIAAIEGHRYARYFVDARAQATQILGLAMWRLDGDARAALPELERSLLLHGQVYDPERSLVVADALAWLAKAQRQSGQTDAAKRSMAEARAIHARHSAVGRHHGELIEQHQR